MPGSDRPRSSVHFVLQRTAYYSPSSDSTKKNDPPLPCLDAASTISVSSCQAKEAALPFSLGLVGPRAINMGNFDNISFGGAIVDDLPVNSPNLQRDPSSSTNGNAGHPLGLRLTWLVWMLRTYSSTKPAVNLLMASSRVNRNPGRLLRTPFPSSPTSQISGLRLMMEPVVVPRHREKSLGTPRYL